MSHWKRPWYWERLKARGEGDDRGWDGWMVSPTRWTWVCVSSRSWWWTGKPSARQSMGLQKVWHDWATELNFLACNLPPRHHLLFRLFNKYPVRTSCVCWALCSMQDARTYYGPVICLRIDRNLSQLIFIKPSEIAKVGFPGGASGKKKKKKTHPPANAGDLRVSGSIPGSGRSPGRGHDNTLQCT